MAEERTRKPTERDERMARERESRGIASDDEGVPEERERHRSRPGAGREAQRQDGARSTDQDDLSGGG